MQFHLGLSGKALARRYNRLFDATLKWAGPNVRALSRLGALCCRWSLHGRCPSLPCRVVYGNCDAPGVRHGYGWFHFLYVQLSHPGRYDTHIHTCTPNAGPWSTRAFLSLSLALHFRSQVRSVEGRLRDLVPCYGISNLICTNFKRGICGMPTVLEKHIRYINFVYSNQNCIVLRLH